MEYRSGGLAAVYNLKVTYTLEHRVAIAPCLNLDLCCRAAKPIVISKETVGLIMNRLLDAFIDLSFCLQESTNVTFQQALSVFTIDARKQRSPQKGEERTILASAVRHLDAWNRATVVIH